jgi:hypothetical protein
MAESVRDENSAVGPVSDQRREIIKEALRQEESCLYTSTALYEWLRWVRTYHRVFVIAPIILGGVAGMTILKSALEDWQMALLTFAASLFPALADALNIQTSVDELTRLAAEFKALQDRFRRLARVTTPFAEAADAEKQLAELMDRLDVARSTSITAPPWAFKKAQEKIAAGHYSFAADEEDNGPVSSQGKL